MHIQPRHFEILQLKTYEQLDNCHRNPYTLRFLRFLIWNGCISMHYINKTKPLYKTRKSGRRQCIAKEKCIRR
jgi:hypothetical protein